MIDILQILIWPFIACLVLTGIHAYFGLHVVSRGVIFVDLSLAQIAALGAAMAALIGFDVHSPSAYLISLGFTLIGALVFSFTRQQKSQIPQEAIIGIVYAVSAAAAVLIMDRIPDGSEHIRHILVGRLLTVTPTEVLKMAGLYLLIGLLHWKFKEPLLMISMNSKQAYDHNIPLQRWDFFFYATFGLVVTSSVAIAGVLLVFSFLIVPPVIAMLFATTVRVRLIISWIVGIGVSFLGMAGSFLLDTPTGATVIVTFGLVLAILAVYKKLTTT